jgi:hypothetical protein
VTESQIEALLGALCVELGFCLSPDASNQIVDHPPETDDAFARALFAAEGLDYETDAREGLKAAVREMVQRHRIAAS